MGEDPQFASFAWDVSLFVALNHFELYEWPSGECTGPVDITVLTVSTECNKIRVRLGVFDKTSGILERSTFDEPRNALLLASCSSIRQFLIIRFWRNCGTPGPAKLNPYYIRFGIGEGKIGNNNLIKLYCITSLSGRDVSFVL